MVNCYFFPTLCGELIVLKRPFWYNDQFNYYLLAEVHFLYVKEGRS